MNTIQTFRKNKKGFTLIELIVVIAIMAVLIALLAPRLIQYIESSRAAADENAAYEYGHAVQNALGEESVYDSLEGNTATVKIDGVAKTVTVSGVKSGDNTLENYIKDIVDVPTWKSKTYKDTNKKVFTITIDSAGTGSRGQKLVNVKYDKTCFAAS